MAKRKAKEDKPPVQMDEKSANSGDRMKHALSLEVLSRTNAWLRVNYSETHAGAGIYRESEQKPAKPYIRNLRERVLWELVRPTIGKKEAVPSAPQAGAVYLELLRQWWQQPDQFESYPGSARQAGEYLSTTARDFSLRLTEADEPTCQRLQKAVANYPGEAKHGSFHDEIEWLTEPDGLYAVVDPFRCVESFTGHTKVPEGTFGVAKGDIDHGIVRDILRRCSKKTAVIMHFWWPTTSQAGKSGLTAIVADSNKKTRKCFRDWESEGEGRCYRQFDDKHNHASALLGLGDGADIVRQVGQLAWTESWLSPFIKTSSSIAAEDEVA